MFLAQHRPQERRWVKEGVGFCEIYDIWRLKMESIVEMFTFYVHFSWVLEMDDVWHIYIYSICEISKRWIKGYWELPEFHWTSEWIGGIPSCSQNDCLSLCFWHSFGACHFKAYCQKQFHATDLKTHTQEQDAWRGIEILKESPEATST